MCQQCERQPLALDDDPDFEPEPPTITDALSILLMESEVYA